MPSPTDSGPVSSVPLTGNNEINSLLWGVKWGNVAGTSATVTYSFPGLDSFWSIDSTRGYGPNTGSGEPWGAFFSPLNSAQQTAAQSALQQWANVAAISFVASQDDASVVGDIRFAWTDNASPTEQAHAYNPATSIPKGGDIWLNSSASGWGDFAPGTYGYFTLLHEIGHSVGLKHPFQAAGSSSSTLSSDDDVTRNTIMSYSAYPGGWGFLGTSIPLPPWH